ncbi:glucocorticoid modulatory element-binding protein 1-like isoform X2 [Betta splendens]|uniref:Glucocorticoid modulatory element-binding protein 1-like isoform X2 n=1 Tax=Betta splendens TaxID=158456 RepID=A0A6P7KRV1_BETSP|nr:glucocorticoid modulatory element-binding protein 1-like isoform X2 [Betta splendens]
MAGAEVTVSSGELMLVKEQEEEGESGGSDHKTQVILHLQPILQGKNGDIADTGTTVLAIKTHDDDSNEEAEETEYGYPITCGDSKAVLLFKKFVCPGINVRCVKFNDQLISPKQFVHLAGKATLKDWKRAIRLGGVMLRKMMDSGQIDFYQHDTACSNTCRSTKFDALINSSRLPPGAAVQPSPSGPALDPHGGRVVRDAADAAEPLEDTLRAAAAAAAWGSGPALLLNPTANGHAAKRKRADTPDGVLRLWRAVADSGLMGEVLSSLHTEVLAALKGVEARSEKADLQEPDAIILNSLCEMFGLLDSVKQAVHLRCSQNQWNKAHNRVYVLNETLEDQRKQGCEKSTSSKHARPQHQNPSKSRAHHMLPPGRTRPVVQALAPTASSTAPHAQLSITPQLATLFPASAGRPHRTGADGMIRDDRNAKLERKNHKHEGTGSPGNPHHGTTGSCREPGRRISESQVAPQLRSEEAKKTKSLCDIERVIIGRKASKKQKSQ